jgi:hypothetical protein
VPCLIPSCFIHPFLAQHVHPCNIYFSCFLNIIATCLLFELLEHYRHMSFELPEHYRHLSVVFVA